MRNPAKATERLVLEAMAKDLEELAELLRTNPSDEELVSHSRKSSEGLALLAATALAAIGSLPDLEAILDQKRITLPSDQFAFFESNVFPNLKRIYDSVTPRDG